jgi:predicted GIY-YIG superfamily endonuclease
VIAYPNPIPKAHGIYMILNCVNGKLYIGCATYLRKRKAAHRCELSKGEHHSEHLQRAWKKYGERAFEFIVIETVENRVGKKGPLHHAFGKKQSPENIQKRMEGIRKAWQRKREQAANLFVLKSEAGTDDPLGQ